MKTHSEFLPQVAAYHDGALPADQRESVASHVRDCPTCQRLLDDWQALDQAVKALPEEAAETDGIKAQVLNRIAPRASAVSSARRSRSAIRIWVPAAAAAILLIAATLWLRDTTHSPGQLELTNRDVPKAPAAPSPTLRPNARDEDQVSEESAKALASAAANEDAADVPEPDPEFSGSKPMADEANSAAVSDQSIAGDSGILQPMGVSARLAEFVVRDYAIFVEVHYRVPDLLDPAIVDVNLRPVFSAEFEGIGYAPTDMLAEAYDPSQAQPRRLSPQVAYMVSSMRMERSVLMSRTSNQVRSPATQLRLAEITWRLANMTADQDDVRNAIAAQTAAMRAIPSISTQSLARLTHLRSLQGRP